MCNHRDAHTLKKKRVKFLLDDVSCQNWVISSICSPSGYKLQWLNVIWSESPSWVMPFHTQTHVHTFCLVLLQWLREISVNRDEMSENERGRGQRSSLRSWLEASVHFLSLNLGWERMNTGIVCCLPADSGWTWAVKICLRSCILVLYGLYSLFKWTTQQTHWHCKKKNAQ